jgi:hypothetical protein
MRVLDLLLQIVVSTYCFNLLFQPVVSTCCFNLLFQPVVSTCCFCHAKPRAPDLSTAGLEHVCWRSIFCALPVHISCVRDLEFRFQKLLQWHFSSRVVNDFCHAKPRAPDLNAAGLEHVWSVSESNDQNFDSCLAIPTTSYPTSRSQVQQEHGFYMHGW